MRRCGAGPLSARLSCKVIGAVMAAYGKRGKAQYSALFPSRLTASELEAGARVVVAAVDAERRERRVLRHGRRVEPVAVDGGQFGVHLVRILVEQVVGAGRQRPVRVQFIA